MKLAPLLAMVVDLGLVLSLHVRRARAAVAARQGRSTRLFHNKWFFDELYDFLFVRPAKGMGYALWRGGE